MATISFDGSLVIDWSSSLGHDCKVAIADWDSGLRVVCQNDGSVSWLSLIDVGDWLFQLSEPAVEVWRATWPMGLSAAISQLPSRQASILSWSVASSVVLDLLVSNPLLLWLLVEDGLFNKRALGEVEQRLQAKQRVLCKSLWLEGSAQQVRILKRAAKENLSCHSVESLVKVMGNDDACDFLSHRKSVDPFTLLLLQKHPWLARHPVRALVDDLHEPKNYSLFRTVQNLLSFDDLDPLLRCTSISSLERLHDRLQANFNDNRGFSPRLDDYGQVERLPPPPLPGNDEIKPLTSQEDIVREGREMNSCVTKYIPRVLRGEYFFYKTRYPERLTIGVLIVADRNGWVPDTFLLQEVRAPFNRQPSKESMEFITDCLKARPIKPLKQLPHLL